MIGKKSIAKNVAWETRIGKIVAQPPSNHPYLQYVSKQNNQTAHCFLPEMSIDTWKTSLQQHKERAFRSWLQSTAIPISQALFATPPIDGPGAGPQPVIITSRKPSETKKNRLRGEKPISGRMAIVKDKRFVEEKVFTKKPSSVIDGNDKLAKPIKSTTNDGDKTDNGFERHKYVFDREMCRKLNVYIKESFD